MTGGDARLGDTELEGQGVIVHAHLRQAGTGKLDAPELEHRQVQAAAPTYEDGRDQIAADLPEGWIVAGWRVDR